MWWFSYILTDFLGGNSDTSKITVLRSLATSDGDVLFGFWDLDTKSPNTFKITSINQSKGTFSGTFDLYFCSQKPIDYPAHYSQGINFLKGKFTLPIPK